MEKMLLSLYNVAQKDFFQNETANILNGVSERNLCSRLAIVFEKQFPNYNLQGYYADPEYNRKQNGRVKTIIDERSIEVSITCDLIVHSRGNTVVNDNLIAIEMKKSHRPEDEKRNDRNRLMALTKSSYDGVWTADGITHPAHVCGYHIGAYMILDIAARKIFNEIYQKGKLTYKWETGF